MVEWSITAVLKTAVLRGTGGSNPSLSAKAKSSLIFNGLFCYICPYPINAYIFATKTYSISSYTFFKNIYLSLTFVLMR